MKKVPFIYLVILAVLCGWWDAGAQDKNSFKPEDFAGTIELTGNAGSLLSLTIPETVYRGLKRPDLGDLRVYDAAGNPVSFLVRKVQGTMETLPEKTVPVFSWDKNTRRFNAPGIEINTSELAVTITGQRGEERDNVYLADLSGLETAPSKLILDFEKSEFFNALLNIRSSDDLVQWNSYGKIQTAAFYNSPGTDRNEFDIPSGRYLLLNFEGKVPAINSGIVRFDPAEIPVLGETFFQGTKNADGKKILYHTGGCFPAAKIKFILSQPDSIRVIVRENNKNTEYWSSVGETIIYRIETPGKETSMSGAFLTTGFSGPYWEIEALGELIFTEIPVLSLIWETKELVFLARGEGPWVLAYGNENCGAAESLFSVGKEVIFPAKIGLQRYAEQNMNIDSGAARKEILLWSVLILSAAVLSGLAVYIINTARKKD